MPQRRPPMFLAPVIAGITLGLMASTAPAHGAGGDPRAARPPGPWMATSNADDGTWQVLLATPHRSYRHAAIYDPVRHRLLVHGQEVWALSLADTPSWSRIEAAGTPPAGRSNHTAVYDPVRDRMLVFGGEVFGASFRNDVWALSLAGVPTWSELAPSGALPSPRTAHTAIFDPVRDRMLVFGGTDGNLRNDAWALTFAGSPEWTQLLPDGIAPAGRSEHAAIYDPTRDRMLVFGGYDGTNRNDTWALALGSGPAWSPMSPDGTPPSARIDHAAIYDPLRDRMLVFGGAHDNQTWALALGGAPAWTVLETAGAGPPERSGPNAVYDPRQDRMIAYGGFDRNLRNDVWVLALAGVPAWSPLGPAGYPPDARSEHTAILDPVSERMLVFGGRPSALNDYQDTWALGLAVAPAWTRLAPAGATPPARSDHTAILDPVRGRMLVFGGGYRDLYHDVWALALAGSPAWSQMVPEGIPPAELSEPVALFDPVRERMILAGVHREPEGPSYTAIWTLSLTGTPAWTRLEPAGSRPPARFGHTAIYDPVRDRVVVFGGRALTSYNDVWALSLAGSPAWSPLDPAGAPPSPRHGHTAIYDPVRDRMVVFGGGDHQVWALALGGAPAWSQLEPAGRTPSPRHGHTAVYEPLRDRMVVFGGDPSGSGNDVWALVWDEVPVSTQVSLAAAEARADRVVLAWYGAGAPGLDARVERRGEATAWSERATVTADATGTFRHEDRHVSPGTRYAYRLAYRSDGERVDTPAYWVTVPPLSFALHGLRPNPARGGLAVMLSLPNHEPAHLEVFDLAGRRVVTRGVSGPGERQLELAGTADLPPGVYTVRLTQGGRTAAARGVLLR